MTYVYSDGGATPHATGLPDFLDKLTAFIEANGWTEDAYFDEYTFVNAGYAVALGDTYTNNGQTFTIVKATSGFQIITATGTGAPSASGTLTRATGTGDASFPFTEFKVGKRYHAHNGSSYVNMRSYNSESPDYQSIFSATSTATYRGLGLNMGTGYSATTSWYNQAGALSFNSSGTKYLCSAMNSIPGPTVSMPYHFFSHNGGDNIIAVLNYGTDKYQFLIFGTDMNKYGTWTGGMYFSGSGYPYEYHELSLGAPSIAFFDSTPYIQSYTSSGGYGAVQVTVDNVSGWHWPNAFNNASRRNIKDYNGFVNTQIHRAQPNTVNNQHIFRPVIVSVGRTASNTAEYSPIGDIPSLFYCHLHNLQAGQQVTLGGTDYRVFPFGKKGATRYTGPTTGGSGSTATLGFAVAE